MGEGSAKPFCGGLTPGGPAVITRSCTLQPCYARVIKRVCATIRTELLAMSSDAAGGDSGAGTGLTKADKARAYRQKLKETLDQAQIDESRRKNRCVPAWKNFCTGYSIRCDVRHRAALVLCAVSRPCSPLLMLCDLHPLALRCSPAPRVADVGHNTL